MTNSNLKHSISFIIPVLNGAKHIERCLDHINAGKDPRDDIVLVDNGSTDATLDIARCYEGVRILQYPHVTIAALRNRGAKVANGDLLAFIDSDCLVCKGWREAIESAICETQVGAAGSHVDIDWNSATWVEKAWIPPRESVSHDTHFLPSGNLVIKKEVFDKVHGFDEGLITDEDTVICNKISERGYRLINTPGAHVIHLGNPKNIVEFILKEKWHAKSIMLSITYSKFDKPMIMTVAFMASWCLLFISIILSALLHFRALPIVPIVLIVPAITALYRTLANKRYKYMFHLILLYLLFYSIRSIVVLKAVFPR